MHLEMPSIECLRSQKRPRRATNIALSTVYLSPTRDRMEPTAWYWVWQTRPEDVGHSHVPGFQTCAFL